jgi:hypothetical protein
LRQDIGTQSLSDDSDPGPKDLILCRILGHRRSSMLAFTEGDGIWRSHCKRCGAAMVRLKHKTWFVSDGRAGQRSLAQGQRETDGQQPDGKE